jgi:Concanavalin A-like lectin/glucanases superfamily
MIISGVTLTGITVADAYVTTQNLAIWIDANNSSSYSGSGVAITDLSGNGRTQNLGSSSQFGTVGGVKCFDCSGTYGIGAVSSGPTLPTTGFTYISWARMIASTANYRTLFRTSPDDHPLLIAQGTNNLGTWDNNGTNFHSAGYDVTNLANVWVQWAVTGDSSGETFYINGQKVGSTVASSSGNNHNIIGNVGLYSASQPFGYVANTFLYTTKLTPTQIGQHYGALRTRFGV